MIELFGWNDVSTTKIPLDEETQCQLRQGYVLMDTPTLVSIAAANSSVSNSGFDPDVAMKTSPETIKKVHDILEGCC